MGTGEYVNKDISIYSRDNLKTISDHIHDEDNKNKSLESLANELDQNYFKDFSKKLKKIIDNEKNQNIITGENAKNNFGNLKENIIKSREKFFENKFLPFLVNPKEVNDKPFSIKDYNKLDNQDAGWKNCFSGEKIDKSFEYRNPWVQASKKELMAINKYNEKNKKNNNNNDDSYYDRYSDDSEYPNTERDRKQYAREGIARLKNIYTDGSSNYDKIKSLLDNNKDYSSAKFLSKFNKEFKTNAFNPLEEKSDLKKFLDVNVDKLCSVMGYLTKSLGYEPPLEEFNDKKKDNKTEAQESDENEDDEERDEDNDEEKYEEDESKKKDPKKIVKKKMKNLKKTILQYMFDAAKMDLDFCHSKIKRYNPEFINEKEEELEQEDKDENSEDNIEDDNNDYESEYEYEDEGEDESGVVSNLWKSTKKVVKKGLTNFKKVAGFMKKAQGGVVGFAKSVVNSRIIGSDSYANAKNDVYKDHCNFLVNMVSNLEEQLQKIGDLDDDTEKENKDKEDSKENEENEENKKINAKKPEFYDPYWYINLDKSKKYKTETGIETKSGRLRNYYLRRAKLAKLYEYIDNKENVDPKIIVGIAKMAGDGSDLAKLLKKKKQKLREPFALKKFENECIFNVSKELSSIKRQIRKLIKDLEIEISKKIDLGKQNCERENNKKYEKEKKMLAFLSEAREFESDDDKDKFAKMSFISDEDYYKATGDSVADLDSLKENIFNPKIKNLEEKLTEGSSNEFFKFPILTKEIVTNIEKIDEKEFPISYEGISKNKKFEKYFDTDELKKMLFKEEQGEDLGDIFSLFEYQVNQEAKNKEEEKRKEDKDRIERINAPLKDDERFKGVELKPIGYREKEKKEKIEQEKNRKAEAKKEESDKIRQEIREDVKESFGVELKKVGSVKIEYKNTPEKFLNSLKEKFDINSMEELKKLLIDDKKNDKNKDKFKQMYEKLKNHYDKLNQKVIDDKKKAIAKSLEGFAPLKKTICDMGGNKESWHINYIFKMPSENWISYNDYHKLSEDNNPSPERYLKFLCVKNINELKTSYDNLIKEEGNNNEYKKAWEYYNKQYHNAKNNIFDEKQNQDNKFRINREVAVPILPVNNNSNEFSLFNFDGEAAAPILPVDDNKKIKNSSVSSENYKPIFSLNLINKPEKRENENSDKLQNTVSTPMSAKNELKQEGLEQNNIARIKKTKETNLVDIDEMKKQNPNLRRNDIIKPLKRKNKKRNKRRNKFKNK